MRLEGISSHAVLRTAHVTRDDPSLDLVGDSDVFRSTRLRLEQVAATDATVLLLGETGTGKGVAARAVHRQSRRRDAKFVSVDCTSLPATLIESELFGREKGAFTDARATQPGRFELADRGTLFLDEIGELPPEAQAKMLRILQDGEFERLGSPRTIRVDVRMIAATNRNLIDDVRAGRFRRDLYYRLNVFPITMPPLRERVTDIPSLTYHLLERLARKHGRDIHTIPPAVLDALIAYDWPGNVRELERIMERAIALATSDCLEVSDLPPALLGGYEEIILPSLRRRDTMREWGSRYARLVLERCQNNKRRACRELGISYHTLQAYLRIRPHPRTAI